ncbi:MAG TPA: MauE/DoxX family redox-associated membrane protein [Dermatophilaceae bacterium]|jgi:hypothetical protein|nr:MauE/DoxX family redox-associated membrane protein [Dermatophilaceae bacterium]
MSDALLLACALLLGASATTHLRHTGATALAVAQHQLLPPRLSAAVAWSLPAVELVLATGLAVASLLGLRPAAPAFGAAAALVFGLFTTYLYAVWRRHPDGMVPCGCGVGRATVGAWAVLRALLLACLAAAGALGGGERPIGARPVEQVVIIAAAALTLACAAGALPDARSRPSNSLPAASPPAASPPAASPPAASRPAASLRATAQPAISRATSVEGVL